MRKIKERQKSNLYEAALRGSVATLLELLQLDPLNLDRVVMDCFSESPLHVAASLGHVDFVKEIIRQKPEHAEEFDSRRHSSLLHIASQKGYVDMVKALLQVNPAMCFASDLEGRNPLHVAAIKGRIDVLRELFRTRPLAASANTIRGETILHLCVKHNQLEALKLLLEYMHDESQLLNAKDDFGMTILHLAVADKQIEVIKFLTSTTMINMNALNANGFTALDILAQSKRDIKDWEIGELLRRAGAYCAKDIQFSANELLGTTTTTVQSNSLTSCENNQKQGKGLESSIKKEDDDWLEKMRNAVMVVASLIATMAFQAGVNPPASPSSSQDTTTSEPQKARVSLHETQRYTCFLTCNTIGFLASLSIILLLISGLPLKRRLFMWILMGTTWVAVTAMALTYKVSMDFMLDSYPMLPYAPYILTYLWFSIVGILLLGHMIRLTVKMIKYFRNSFRRPTHIYHLLEMCKTLME